MVGQSRQIRHEIVLQIPVLGQSGFRCSNDYKGEECSYKPIHV